ncbi:MAG: hypothetical protein U9R08_02925 [Nanoarchaeota archaeon]|nr:hypothetical protein [Nanoarchaeota archaeon]
MNKNSNKKSKKKLKSVENKIVKREDGEDILVTTLKDGSTTESIL